MAEKKVRIALPGQCLTPGAPVQPRLPNSTDPPIVRPQAAEVGWTTVILIVSSKLPIEGLTLFRDWIMQMLLAPNRDRFQAAFEPFPHRPNVDGEVSFPAS